MLSGNFTRKKVRQMTKKKFDEMAKQYISFPEGQEIAGMQTLGYSIIEVMEYLGCEMAVRWASLYGAPRGVNPLKYQAYRIIEMAA